MLIGSAKDAATLTLNTEPFGSPAFCRALAELAGVKQRKARVYAMADPGRVTSQTADRCANALRCWRGVVCWRTATLHALLRHLRACWFVGSAAAGAVVVDGLRRSGWRVHKFDATGEASAHGALAGVLKLPVPVVGAGPLDPAGVLAAAEARWPEGLPVAIVVTLRRGCDPTAYAWAAALLRACRTGSCRPAAMVIVGDGLVDAHELLAGPGVYRILLG